MSIEGFVQSMKGWEAELRQLIADKIKANRGVHKLKDTMKERAELEKVREAIHAATRRGVGYTGGALV